MRLRLSEYAAQLALCVVVAAILCLARPEIGAAEPQAAVQALSDNAMIGDDARVARIRIDHFEAAPADIHAWLHDRFDTCAIDRDDDGSRHAVFFLDPADLAILRQRGVPIEDAGSLADHIASFAPWKTLSQKRIPSIERFIGGPMVESQSPGGTDPRGAPGCEAIGTSLMPYDVYHDIDESYCFLQNLAAAYPDITRLISVGQSREGRNIWALKITLNPDVESPDKEKILLKGVTHAREWATHETMLYIAEHLTTGYATDPKVKRIVDNSVVWLIPIVNPDGYAFSWTNIRMWRKNRRINPVSNCTSNPNTSTCCGVDLNRNYAYKWGFDTQGSSGNACAETYRGPSAASEPETVAIQNLVAQQKFAVSVSYHSYSQLWLFSWGYTTQVTPESFTSMRAMARKLSELVADTHGLTYVHGQSSYTIYRTNGDFNDYAYGQHGVLSFTPEVRPRLSSEGGFLLPEAQILACAEENLAAALWLMENVADAVDLRKPDDSPLFDTVGVNQTLELSLPATPTRQRPTESIGLPDAFRGQLLALQYDALHNPPAWGAFPADYEGCGTGSGYELHINSETDLADWANGVVTYRALPHIFEDGADVMLSNVEPGLNVIGIPSHLPVALADVSIIRRKLDAATTDFGVTENVLEMTFPLSLVHLLC